MRLRKEKLTGYLTLNLRCLRNDWSVRQWRVWESVMLARSPKGFQKGIGQFI